MIKKIAVLGLGKVGTLVADLLNDAGFEVIGYDSVSREDLKYKVITGDVTNYDFIKAELSKVDAVVSCLPYHLNMRIVDAAYENGISYFDLTEDVKTADYIESLSKKSRGVMAPQCGLAPGFIAIAGSSLAKKFNKIRSIELRVGALPQSPQGDLGYAFNWSAEGVVNEYLNDCKILKDGEIKFVPAMQDLEQIIINGTVLEAFTTSGGLGTMCETFKDKVDELNYKTMRYPGHMKLMRFFFHELLMRENRIEAGEILVNAAPPVSNDVVYVHAAVDGMRESVGKERHFKDEFVKAYYPQKICGKMWRAISWTTACSICSAIELVAKGKIKEKFVKQENINLEDFLNTKSGSYYSR
jgi:saccharopine dehydrogenase-like NADP-dependent oxidoreductase